MQNFPLNENGGWIVPQGTVFPAHTEFPAFSEFGESCTIPPGSTLEGVVMERWLQTDNVDGSGRQLLLIKHADGVCIRAGCFVGSVEEFVKKAEHKGKQKYVNIVSAVAALL